MSKESNREKLQRYALVGVRARLIELVEEFADLRDSFGVVGGFATMLAALTSTIDEIDEQGQVRPQARPRIANGAARPKPKHANGAARPKPKHANGAAKKRSMPAGAISASRARSWLTGRDVLAVLDKAPGGAAHFDDIAKRLKIHRATARTRMNVRAKHGHTRPVGDGTYQITDEGRAALAADRDSGA